MAIRKPGDKLANMVDVMVGDERLSVDETALKELGKNRFEKHEFLAVTRKKPMKRDRISGY